MENKDGCCELCGGEGVSKELFEKMLCQDCLDGFAIDDTTWRILSNMEYLQEMVNQRKQQGKPSIRINNELIQMILKLGYLLHLCEADGEIGFISGGCRQEPEL